MNRTMRRISQKAGRSMQKLDWNSFTDVTKEAIARHAVLSPGDNFRSDLVFQNNKYIVQVFFSVIRKDRSYTKVMVRRSDGEPIYSWQDLFRIKNEIFGDETEAVQFMPKVSELVDVANLYWFFIEDFK